LGDDGCYLWTMEGSQILIKEGQMTRNGFTAKKHDREMDKAEKRAAKQEKKQLRKEVKNNG